MKLSQKLLLRRISVWAARIVVGLTFMISGWAKAIDPWGFVIKVGEYLGVWGLDVPHEAIVAGSVALACAEFCTGVLIAVGAMKRLSVWTAAAMMAFMLPLTIYIAVADPVDDCGCFGDLWHISNGATLAKNIVLTALVVYLVVRNRTVGGIYPAPVQWLVISVSFAFPLTLALAGYQIQPLIDFRPYKTGTSIFASAGHDSEEYFTYEKNGERRKFTLDALPDSTWTFVEDETPASESGFDGGIAVRDENGDDVSADIVSDRDRQLFLIIPEPGMHYLSSAHYVNRLSDYCAKNGIELIAIVGSTGERLDTWLDWCRPDFDVYSADATSLKQLVRGPEALVYTDGGIIVWKRILASMPPALPDGDAGALAALRAPDDGFYHSCIAALWLASMAIIYLLSLSPKILRLFMRRGK